MSTKALQDAKVIMATMERAIDGPSLSSVYELIGLLKLLSADEAEEFEAFAKLVLS